jgi:small-conductance mechanosensitive channel
MAIIGIIFLFIKHPFDVGDRVVINGTSYTVKEVGIAVRLGHS